MKKVRILSIDGGGIRGILPGIYLTALEKKIQDKKNDKSIRLADMFDFMAGTSTGGLLVLSYLVPDPNDKKRPKFSAWDAVNFYLENGDEIFDVSLWQKIKSLGGVADEKYDAKDLEEALENVFKDEELKNVLKPCIIPSYNIREGAPHFFTPSDANKDDALNFKLRDVARAASAAPTYFEIPRIKSKKGKHYPLIDGGVFANNPALVAYSEVRKMNFGNIQKPTAKDMMIVSIDTGCQSEKYEYKKAKDWGMVGWVKPIIEIMMSGVAHTVAHHLKKIYNTLENEDEKDYYRIEMEVDKADIGMDNATIKNMNKLRKDAQIFIRKEENDKKLDEIAEKLIQYGEE